MPTATSRCPKRNPNRRRRTLPLKLQSTTTTALVTTTVMTTSRRRWRKPSLRRRRLQEKVAAEKAGHRFLQLFIFSPKRDSFFFSSVAFDYYLVIVLDIFKIYV